MRNGMGYRGMEWDTVREGEQNRMNWAERDELGIAGMNWDYRRNQLEWSGD